MCPKVERSFMCKISCLQKKFLFFSESDNGAALKSNISRALRMQFSLVKIEITIFNPAKLGRYAGQS